VSMAADSPRCFCGRFGMSGFSSGFDQRDNTWHSLNACSERQADLFAPEPDDERHEPVEEWVGYPMTICSRCLVQWPCDRAQELNLAG
jgi:hypothetical protein